MTCAQGILDTQGLPTAPLGSFAVLLGSEGLSRDQQLEVITAVARDIWISDLAVGSVSVSFPAGPYVGEALGGSGSSADGDELEAAFGPRPPRPSPPLPPIEDPGNPDC